MIIGLDSRATGTYLISPFELDAVNSRILALATAATATALQFIPAFSAKADPKTGRKYDIKAPYTSAGALLPEGVTGARLRPDTFGKIFTTADRWSRAKG
ncbi:hypothetical protein [Actinoallomurus sp. NPDC050550]|uniref:hypothetical protein n=1 Tax=Actinoallomurus sp. NPDC050550 TaxID=3154937 RepID=UPI00340B013E